MTNKLIYFSGILFGLKLASTRVYTVTAGEGLILLLFIFSTLQTHVERMLV